MPRKIFVRGKAQDRLNRHLDDYANLVLSDWRIWLSNQRRWNQAYRGFLTPRRGVDEGKPNLFIPATGIGVERLHSNFMTSINRPNALLEVQPTEMADTSLARTAREFLSWDFFSIQKAPVQLDQALKTMLINGRVVGIMAWHTKRRKRHIPGYVPKEQIGSSRDPRRVARWHYGDQISDMTLLDPNTVALDLIVNGRKREATVTLLTDAERCDPSEDEYEYEVETVEEMYNAPKLYQPLSEDCLISADSPDPQEARFVRYQTWRTFEEIAADFDADYYYHLDREVMRDLATSVAKWETGSATEAENTTRSYTEQTSGVATQSALRRSHFCIQKFFCPWDIDGDGTNEEMVITRLVDTAGRAHIARIDHLDYISPSGKRPIFKIDYITLPGQPVAIGVPEWTRALQSEINFLRNNRVLKNEIITNPFGFYAAGSTLNPTTMKIKPGDWIPIDDPRNIYMPSFPQSTGADVLEEQNVTSWLEKMIPIGNTPMGRAGGRETAFGRAALLAQTDEITEKNHWQVGRGIEEFGDLTLGFYGAFMPPQLEFRVLGSDELIRFRRGALVGFDTRCVLTALSGNKAELRQIALMRLQALSPHPMLQSEQRQWELLSDFLEATECRMPERLIGKSPDETAHPPLTPAQEHAKFIQGMTYEPTMQDDDESHIAEHRAFLLTPLGRLGPVSRITRQHIEHHIRKMNTAGRQQQGMLQGRMGQVETDPAAAQAAGIGAQQLQQALEQSSVQQQATYMGVTNGAAR